MTLRDHRRAADLTLAQLASALGVSVGFVSKVERGVKPLPPRLDAAWAAALGVEGPLVPRCPECGR